METTRAEFVFVKPPFYKGFLYGVLVDFYMFFDIIEVKNVVKNGELYHHAIAGYGDKRI